MPVKHERVWQVLLPLAIGATILGPFPFTWEVFNHPYAVHISSLDSTKFTLLLNQTYEQMTSVCYRPTYR